MKTLLAVFVIGLSGLVAFQSFYLADVRNENALDLEVLKAQRDTYKKTAELDQRALDTLFAADKKLEAALRNQIVEAGRCAEDLEAMAKALERNHLSVSLPKRHGEGL